MALQVFFSCLNMPLKLIFASTSEPANLDFEATLQHFLVFFRAFGRSKITSKSSSMRFSGKRKNLKKCHRVASKSRFAGPEVDAKMSSRSNLRPAKNASSANPRKSQIFDRFGVHFGSPNRCKIASKIQSKIDHAKKSPKSPKRVSRM